jgi:hypothetical protein
LSSSPIVVISPVVVGQPPAPSWEYSDIPGEFIQAPALAELLRFITYPWAYQPQNTRIVGRVPPP